jgi:hypothetical protein
MHKSVLWMMLALTATIDAALGEEPAATRAYPTLSIGSIPEDELGRDLEGNKVHISDYRDKVVIVSFWASCARPARRNCPCLPAW